MDKAGLWDKKTRHQQGGGLFFVVVEVILS